MASHLYQCAICRQTFRGIPQYRTHFNKKHRASTPDYVEAVLLEAPDVMVHDPQGQEVNDMENTTLDDPSKDVNDSPHEDDEIDERDTLDHRIWATLANLNQAYGISRSDLESILDLLGSVSVSEEMTAVTSLKGFDEYQERMLKESPWIVAPKYTTQVTIDKSDVPFFGEEETLTVDFHYEDMKHFLEMEFGDKAYRGQFVKHFQLVQDEAGERWVLKVIVIPTRFLVDFLSFVLCRVFGEPHQGMLWQWFESRIRDTTLVRNGASDKEGVVGALQMYSDKTVVDNKGNSNITQFKYSLMHLKNTPFFYRT